MWRPNNGTFGPLAAVIETRRWKLEVRESAEDTAGGELEALSADRPGGVVYLGCRSDNVQWERTPRI